MPQISDSSVLANLAVKYLNGGKTDKAIYKAVLLACPEMPDLMPQTTIDEAVARIKRGISVADQVVQA